MVPSSVGVRRKPRHDIDPPFSRNPTGSVPSVDEGLDEAENVPCALERDQKPGSPFRPTNACSVPQEPRADCGKKRDPRGDEPDQRKEFDLDNTARLKKQTLLQVHWISRKEAAAGGCAWASDDCRHNGGMILAGRKTPLHFRWVRALSAGAWTTLRRKGTAVLACIYAG